jgi:hypothetical protein
MNKPVKIAETVGDVLDKMDEARNIAQRLNAVMAEVDYVQKQPKKDGLQYSYVSHDAVTKLVRPILQAHGIVYYPKDLEVRQNGNRTEALFTVRFENIDNRADYIDVATFGYGVDGQDKGPGKAMSYGVKYALLKALGLETGDDPETDQGPEADFKPSSAGMITDAQIASIEALLGKAGRTAKQVSAAFGRTDLIELTAEEAGKALKRLNDIIREPVNA